ncbi:MAG: hypothetical protein ACKPKO_57410, partial [Candidatus Fonsibacter sp.]
MAAVCSGAIISTATTTTAAKQKVATLSWWLIGSLYIGIGACWALVRSTPLHIHVVMKLVYHRSKTES